MSKYRRLDFNKLHFAKTPVSYEEAVKDTTPCTIAGTKIQITEAEKDYKKKAIRIKISQ